MTGTVKVLLTGFEPFGRWVSNPSQDVAKSFKGQSLRLADGHGVAKITCVVLPVGYYEAYAALAAAIQKRKPDVVVSVGLAAGAPALTLETVGRNVMVASIADAAGRTPQNEPIAPAGEPEYRTNVESERLVEALHARGLNVILSDNAGGYVCNATIYQAMWHITRDHLPIRYTFLHTPWTDAYPVEDAGLVKIPAADLRLAVETIIKTLAET